jgi:hypothetical protein
MTLAADHQVVVDRDPQRLGGLSDLPGHLDVVARRLGVARRMIVDKQTGRSIDLIRYIS